MAMNSAFGTIAIVNTPSVAGPVSPALSSTPRPERVSHNTRSFSTVYSDLMTELYNEPTQGLYFVNQHLETMGPRLITIKYELDSIRQKLSTALTDVTEDIDAVDKILKSQCNLDGQSNEVQKLRHDFGHSMKKRSSSRENARAALKKQDKDKDKDKNDDNMEQKLDNEIDEEPKKQRTTDDENDFGFGEFLQISVMLSQCRSLVEFARNLDEQQ